MLQTQVYRYLVKCPVLTLLIRYPEVEVQDVMIILFSTFFVELLPFSIVAPPFCIPIDSAQSALSYLMYLIM